MYFQIDKLKKTTLKLKPESVLSMLQEDST